MAAPLWTPSADQIARANLTRFIDQVRALGDRTSVITDFDSLYDWSIRDLELFWTELWRFAGVLTGGQDPAIPHGRVLIGRDRVAPPDAELGPKWFVGTRLNFAENLLRYRDDREAIVSWNELGAQRRLTYRQLSDSVAGVATALRAMGIGVGDRVAAFMPNIPETVIAMLATTSIGAVWSSCSPDFGVNGVLDRFGQIQPRVLFVADGYRYSGREIDSLERIREIADRIPEIERVIVVPYLRSDCDIRSIRGATLWNDVASSGSAAPPTFEHLAFDHPAYIMYSSGTTGLPKCMVHGAGGTLIQHLKELELLTDGFAVGAGQLLGGQPRGVGLEDEPNLGDARQVGDVDVGDERSAVGDRANQVLAGEALQRLPDRRAADLELLLEPRLVDDRARPHLEPQDALEDAAVRLLALRSCGDALGYRQGPHPFNLDRDMRPIYRRGTYHRPVATSIRGFAHPAPEPV